MKAVNTLLVAMCLIGVFAVAHMRRELDRLEAAAGSRHSRHEAGARSASAPRQTLPKAVSRGSQPGRASGGSAVDISTAQARAWLAGEEGRRISQRVAEGRLIEGINSQYGPLLKRLNLDADTVARFEGLIAEERLTAVDAIEAAKANGIQSAQGYLAAVREAVGEVDGQIEGLLGPDDFQAFLAYRQDLPEEETVNQLADRLAGTETPLSDGQQAQLVQLLNQMEPPSYRQNEDFLAAIGVQEAPLTAAAVGAASGVLAPPQAAALQTMYDELQAKVAAITLLRQQAKEP